MKLKDKAVLINNTGICILGKFINTTEEEYDRVMDTNLKGIFLASDDSDYFQGQNLYMDGGIMIQQRPPLHNNI
ncbi:SDR family NAD(P)-dependent oxidoreductase [bacterium]|nr:SDR family NAD(P)-dependent oxidoreductase [bacterium]